MTTLLCDCPGVPYETCPPCDRPITQEDMRCDICRTIDCPTCETPLIYLERECTVLAELFKAWSS